MRTILILTDTHIELVDPAYWAIVLQVARRIKLTDIVLAGDFVEGAAVTGHGDGGGQDWRDTEAACTSAFTALRACAPKATITYLEGNHETRLARTLASGAPGLAKAITLPRLLDLKSHNIAYIPETGVYRCGKLLVTHGHQIGGKFGTKLPAEKLAQAYLAPGRVVAAGHFHRRQHFTVPVWAKSGVQYTSAHILGTGRDMSAPWLHGAIHGWSHGFGLARVQGSWVDLQSIEIKNGLAVVDGRIYRS